MKPILSIQGWSSKCLNCGAGANPEEKVHDTVLGYGVEPGTKGCGIEWEKVTCEFGNNLEAKAAGELRPDLEWIDPWSEEVVQPTL